MYYPPAKFVDVMPCSVVFVLLAYTHAYRADKRPTHAGDYVGVRKKISGFSGHVIISGCRSLPQSSVYGHRPQARRACRDRQLPQICR